MIRYHHVVQSDPQVCCPVELLEVFRHELLLLRRPGKRTFFVNAILFLMEEEKENYLAT